MFELKNYQEKHVTSLKCKIDDFLKLGSPKLCVLKSPTGSGKTIMMAETIQRLADNREDGKEIAFIWIAVHKLHDQSKEKLEKYFEDLQAINCSYFEDLQDQQIQDMEVLFFNWHSINQEDNIYIRDNENDFNLSSVVENTKSAGREIVLIIDESHHTASGEKSREVIKKISPKIIVEVSATPQISNPDYIESIDIEEVKNEGMIKKLIKINHNLEEPQTSTNEWILKAALDKRQELKDSYEQAGSNVNPLVIIQIPDRQQGRADMQEEITRILSKYDITTDNGRLAIYLSEDKTNLENIQKPDNEVQALIFKQAITIGWDCPRASILALFREWREYEFSIQTIGRIMRMPEIKHYDSEILDNAYVYTNIEKMEIAQDVVEDYITRYESKRDDDLYDKLDLQSIYIRRKHEKTRLTGKFSKIFDRIAKDANLMDSIDLKLQELSRGIIINGEIDNLDQKQTVKGKVISTASSPAEIQHVFDTFARNCSSGFAPVHSGERIKRSLYAFLEPVGKNLEDVQKLVLAKNNKIRFIDAINRSKEAYTKEIVERAKREVEDIPNWNVPKVIEYTKLHEEREYKRCVVSPVYVRTSVKNEDRFMDFINMSDGVKWWFKNGENDKKYFAIKYTDPDDGLPHPFYVDFVIRMHDGRTGLFDPKDGFTAKIAKPKAEALSRYIKDNQSKRVFGGVAVFENGEWMYNDDEEYEFDGKDFSDWKPIDLN